MEAALRGWSESEPSRFRKDTAALAAFAPKLIWDPAAQGWIGELPVWTFDRPKPDGLDALLPRGLNVALCPPPAYPMVTPAIYPIGPQPEVWTRTDHRWHVAGDGRLCLTKTPGQWDPIQPVTTLLDRAVGWHVEYALMMRGLVTEMTEYSIAADDSLDHLVSAAGSLPVLSDVQWIELASSAATA
jgi:hypothetical protein